MTDWTNKIFKEDKWDKYFLRMSELVASKSKDPSTKSGCVIVGPEHEVRSTGFNGFPMGVNDDIKERYERPVKYSYAEHCERNAIYLAARNGISLKGCTLYVNWHPCVDCARAMIQAGIIRVVYLPTSDELYERWGKDFEIAETMWREARVSFEEKTC